MKVLINVGAQPPTLFQKDFYIGPPSIIPILLCRVAWPDNDHVEHFVDIKVGIETVGLGIDQIERQVCQSLRSHRVIFWKCPIPFDDNLQKLSKLFVSMVLKHPRFPSILQLVYPVMVSTYSLSA